MLNILRKRAQSIVIQVVVLAIAIVFIFWGVGTNLGNKRNLMATVNGNEIPIADYQRAYDSTVDNYRAQFGGAIPQGFLEALDLKRQVINQLIQTAILRQSGGKMGITVSREETQNEIKNLDVFKTNNQFDLNLYKQVLSQNRMNPSFFEAGLRNDLLTRKVTEAVQEFALVPDSEVQLRVDLNNEEIKLAYFKVNSDAFLDKVDVRDEELAKWYEENKNNYLTEPAIRLKYLFFGYDEDLGQMQVSEEAIEQRYENTKDKYVVPERRHARHILFEVKESDSVEKRAEQKQKAEEVLKLAREGQDFAELAKKYSEGPTGPKGGDLGFFARGTMVPAFDAVVFQLKPGEISDVVETRFGYHIIKLEEVQEKKVRPLDEVRNEIADEIKNEEVKSYTFKKASQAYEDIIRSGSLAKYSEQHEGNVQQTDYFTRESPPGAPLSDPKLVQTAFSLKKGELSSLVETPEGYAILYADDIHSPEVPALQTIKTRVTEDFKKARSVELARQDAEKILQDAREKKSLAQAVPSGAGISETGFIRRSAGGEDQDLPPQVIRQSFDLSSRDPFPKVPFAQDDAFIVYEMTERKTGDEILDEQQRRQLEEQLLTTKKNELLQAWMVCMRDKADIWVNDQLLQ